MKGIRAGAMFDGVKDTLHRDVVVWVDDEGRIAEVSVGDSGSHAGIEHDLGERTLLPGLINAHDHLQIDATPERLEKLNAASDVENALRMAGRAHQALWAGVTTFRECGAKHRLDIAVRDAIAEGTLPGPRILACGLPLTSVGGHLDWMGREVEGAADMHDAVIEQVHAGADHIKLCASGGMLEATSDIYAVQFSDEELAVARAEARAHGRRIGAHAHNADSIRAVVKAGFDTVEHCLWINRGGRVDVDDTVVERMASEGIAVVPTIATGFPKGGARPHWVAAVGPLDERLAVLRHMHERGVPLLAGTDDGRYSEFVYELELMRSIGLSAFEVLRSATSLSGEYLRLEEGLGSIRAGAPADLIAVTGNPLDDVSALWSVTAVFTAGRRVR